MRAKLSVPRLKGLAVTAALGLILGGAGFAGALATSASTSVASQAASTGAVHHAVLDQEFIIGPVASFDDEEACVLFGEAEFPPGSTYLGYVVVSPFCEYGPATPPLVGDAWNVFLVVENPSCPSDSATNAQSVNERAGPRVIIC